MLPPIDDAVLQSNPKFARLHANLTNNILSPNGSTKNHPAQKERDAVKEALKAARIQSAKSSFLKSALASLDLSPQSAPSTTTSSKLKAPSSSQQPRQQSISLPAELIELILLLSSYLTSGPLTPSSQKLLDSTTTWTCLPVHIPKIATLLSTHLQTQALALARVHSPSTNASYLHRSIPKLVPAIQSSQLSIQESKTNLAKRRGELVSKTTTLLSLYYLATTLTILHLEQTKHGLLSRHIRSKTDLLALTAKITEYEAREKATRGERLVYTEEVKSALGEYMRNLRDGRERLKEKKATAQRVLWGYGVGREDSGKERTMKEIARVYDEMLIEVKDVGRDVERLRGK